MRLYYSRRKQNKKIYEPQGTVPGGLLLANNCSDKAVNALLNALSDKIKSKAIYTEFRNYHDYGDKKEIF